MILNKYSFYAGVFEPFFLIMSTESDKINYRYIKATMNIHCIARAVRIHVDFMWQALVVVYSMIQCTLYVTLNPLATS